jgi:pseudouridine-5'-phosphate glycosidase/pseudouridine kinase
LHDLHKYPQSKFLQVSEEVRDAVATGKPVVALETTIYTHGFPYPDNIALASLLESVVRVNGGVPATIGIIGGIARVGLSADEIIELASTAENKSALKVSRRDLGYICGMV